MNGYKNPFLTIGEKYKIAEELAKEKHYEEIHDIVMKMMGEGLFKYGLQPKMPKIDFRKKGCVAATAYTSKEWRISINPFLLLENEADFIQQTIPHECCHLLADRFHNASCHHDRRWKKVMLDFGLPPKRCHNYDLKEVKVKRRKKIWTFVCDCKTWKLNTRKKNIALNPKTVKGYYCKKCGTTLHATPETLRGEFSYA